MDSFKNIFEQILANGMESKPFYIDENKQYSFKEFAKKINKIKTLAKHLGIKPDDHILVSISNDYDLICIVMALILNGVVVILVGPEEKAKRVQGILNSAQITGWIVDKENVVAWNLDPNLINLSIENPSENKGTVLRKLLRKQEENKQTISGLIDQLEPTIVNRDLNVENPAIIIFTSGTTKAPKGVVLTQKNILSHLATLSKVYQLNPNSVISNILPLFHADGLFQGPFLALFNQATLSRPFQFEVQTIEDLLHYVYKHKVSHFITVPTILTLIAKYGNELSDSFKTREFKYVISSADYLQESLWKRFMEKFQVNIINVYGLTETVAGGIFCGPSQDTWRLGSIGKPQDLQVKIIKENDRNNKGKVIGELAVKGENVLKSYLIPTDNPDKEGWFYTGDIVEQDEDGFLYIKGRKKNIIIKGGINIYPDDVIEELQNHKDILETYIYGLADELWGERVIAAIIKNDSSSVTGDQIIQYCKECLPAAHVPDEVHFLKELPKSPSGKILSEEVKLMIQQSQTGDSMRLLNNEKLETELLKLASDCFNRTLTTDHLNEPSHSIQGWNSLEHLHFVSLIENFYNIELSTRDIMNITSISSAVSIVTTNLEKRQ